MDKKYLFKRNNIWWVKVAVPKRYREDLGYDLRQTTGEKDLEKALLVRDAIVSELKSSFEKNLKIDTDTKDFLQKTDISDPQYFHKVVDCQYACPAHTNVPEYIRLIAQQKYTDAYM